MKITIKCKKGNFSTRELKHIIENGLGPLYIDKKEGKDDIKKIKTIKDLQNVITEQYKKGEEATLKLLEEDVFKGFVTDIEYIKEKERIIDLLNKIALNNVNIELDSNLKKISLLIT